MEATELLEIGHESLWLLIKISAPVMLVALVVGLLISLFQALTQIQESTLSFVPKILSIFFCLMLTTPWMVATLKVFVEHLFDRIVHIP